MTGGYWREFGPELRRIFRCDALTRRGDWHRCRRNATWGWRQKPHTMSKVVFCTQHARQEGAPR